MMMDIFVVFLKIHADDTLFIPRNLSVDLEPNIIDDETLQYMLECTNYYNTIWSQY